MFLIIIYQTKTYNSLSNPFEGSDERIADVLIF